jgi:hypothetical protein
MTNNAQIGVDRDPIAGDDGSCLTSLHAAGDGDGKLARAAPHPKGRRIAAHDPPEDERRLAESLKRRFEKRRNTR